MSFACLLELNLCRIAGLQDCISTFITAYNLPSTFHLPEESFQSSIQALVLSAMHICNCSQIFEQAVGDLKEEVLKLSPVW